MTDRVDAHHHVWDLAVRDQPWTADRPGLRRSFAIDQLRPLAAAERITGTVVVQTVCVTAETPELLALAAADPLVAGVVGWLDLTAPAVTDDLAALLDGPGGRWLVGIRHQVQQEATDWLDRPDARRGLAAVAAAGLAYDLVVRADQLPAVARAVAALPGLRFVLDHGGKPDIAADRWQPWADDITVVAGRPNVAVKISGLGSQADGGPGRPPYADRVARYATHLLDRFGPQRTMFGSDWPVCTLVGGYHDAVSVAEVASAGLTPAERAAVFGDTARTWYRLPR